MILASRTPQGKVQYFDARTGMKYHPYREQGTHQGRIPDWAIRFLQPKIERKTGLGNSDQKTVVPLPEPVEGPETPRSLWTRFVDWLNR